MAIPAGRRGARQTATEFQRAYREPFLALCQPRRQSHPAADADRLLVPLDGSTVAAVALGSRHPIDHAGQTAGELASRWPHAITPHKALDSQTRR